MHTEGYNHACSNQMHVLMWRATTRKEVKTEARVYNKNCTCMHTMSCRGLRMENTKFKASLAQPYACMHTKIAI